MVRRIAGWALVAFLLFMVVTNPAGAAHGIHHILHGVSTVATRLGAFATALGNS